MIPNAEDYRHLVEKKDKLVGETDDKLHLEVDCPCCQAGKVQMEISTRHSTVMAKCTNHGPKGKCGSHSVLMPYNVAPKHRMVDNGIQ